MTSSPTGASRTLRGRPTDFQSSFFSLTGVAPADMPPTVCTSCPASLWREQNGVLCFCNLMKETTWTSSKAPVTCCDGREASLAKLEMERAQPRK